MTLGSRAARAVLSALVVSALAIGCSGSTASPSPAHVNRVDLPPSYKFVPADIVVNAGTTVTWTNNDHFTHSVQFLDGGLPSQPLVFDPGKSVTFTFDHAGLFHYQCSLHPQNMKGSVSVTQ